MTHADFESMVLRRMKNTGEERAEAEAQIRALLGRLNTGQMQLVALPDGSAVLVEVRN